MRNPQKINWKKSQKGGLATLLFHIIKFLLLITYLFLPPSTFHHPVSISLPLCAFPFLLPHFSLCFGEMNYRCGSSSSSNSRSSEVDDEPSCMEEINYSADSSSDPEPNFTELDRQIQECAFHKDEEEEGTEWRRRSVPQS